MAITGTRDGGDDEERVARIDAQNPPPPPVYFILHRVFERGNSRGKKIVTIIRRNHVSFLRRLFTSTR